MTFRLLRAVALVAALGWTAVPAHAQTTGTDGADAGADPVVARIDGAEIKRSDLEAAQRSLPAQYRQIPLQSIFEPLLRQVINTTLIVRAARAQGLHDDPAVKKQVAAMEGRVLEQVYLERLVETQVTEAALRKDYQASIAGVEGEVEVRARHILLKTEKEAMAVIDELRKTKADFAELAKKHSTGPSGPRGGDLGFFARGRMVKPFSDAAFDMKPGEVSNKPVQTQFGWHVIKVEERRTGSVPSFEESREKLSGELTQRVITEAVGTLRKDAKIETFGLDGGAPAPRRIQRVQ